VGKGWEITGKTLIFVQESVEWLSIIPTYAATAFFDNGVFVGVGSIILFSNQISSFG
jgi:hypothetical protein